MGEILIDFMQHELPVSYISIPDQCSLDLSIFPEIDYTSLSFKTMTKNDRLKHTKIK